MAKLIDGRKTVTAAGTAEPLSATDEFVLGVQITALDSNSGTVVVGASTVVAASATRRGTPLAPGESMVLNGGHSGQGGGINLAGVYADVTNAGDGFSYTALKP